MRTTAPKPILTFLFILLIVSCTQVEWTDIKTIKPGYIAFSDSSTVSLVLTKDQTTGYVSYDPVDIRLRFLFTSQTAALVSS